MEKMSPLDAQLMQEAVKVLVEPLHFALMSLTVALGKRPDAPELYATAYSFLQQIDESSETSPETISRALKLLQPLSVSGTRHQKPS